MAETRTTIRNIDPKVLNAARHVVEADAGLTMGRFMTYAIYAYLVKLAEEEERVKAINWEDYAGQ